MKRWWQPFYAAREHRGFPTNIAIGIKIWYPHFWTNVTLRLAVDMKFPHPYPYPYSQTFIPRTPNPEFLQFFYSTLPEKKHGADISLLKLLKTSKSKKNKHTCALKCTILAEYVKFRENLHNFIDAWIRWPWIRYVCRLSVLGLSVTHVLWLNGTSKTFGDDAVG